MFACVSGLSVRQWHIVHARVGVELKSSTVQSPMHAKQWHHSRSPIQKLIFSFHYYYNNNKCLISKRNSLHLLLFYFFNMQQAFYVHKSNLGYIVFIKKFPFESLSIVILWLIFVVVFFLVLNIWLWIPWKLIIQSLIRSCLFHEKENNKFSDI